VVRLAYPHQPSPLLASYIAVPKSIVLIAIMTWVLGWPLEVEYAVQYAKDRKLCGDCTDDIDRLYHAAGWDITRRLGVPPQDVPVLACWDKDDLKAVYAICIDKKAKTAADARIRLSRMPPQSVALKLGCLLGAKQGPKWYEYDDGCAYDESDSDSDSSDEPDDSSDAESEPQSPVEEPSHDAETVYENDEMNGAVTGAKSVSEDTKTKSLEIATFADKAVQAEETA